MNLTDTFIELIKIDSPSGSEESLRGWIIQWAKSHSLSVSLDNTGNLLVKRSGIKRTPFFFCAHMDTVEPGKNIKPIINQQEARSDGTTILGADNKAALAAIMVAVDDWLKQNQNLGIELLFTVKEETGGGAENFDANKLEAKVGYIFDYAAPIGTIVQTSPYIINFEITFSGKSAHACFSQKGVNPLKFVANFLSDLDLGVSPAQKTSVNIGLINGGSAINAIPGIIKVQGEIRSFSEAKFQQKLAEIQKKNQKIEFSIP